MPIQRWSRSAAIRVVAGVLFGVASLLPMASAHATPNAALQAKAAPRVLAAIERNEDDIEVLLRLAPRADAALLAPELPPLQRRRAWIGMLQATAHASQTDLRDWLVAHGIEYRAFWISNTLWLRGNAATLGALAERPEVQALDANAVYHNRLPLAGPSIDSRDPVPRQTETVEWGINKINAPLVWAAGVTGQGVVIAGEDTGYRWDHVVLKAKYRGWDGSTANHNYNWHDAIHVANSSCAADTQSPCDDDGHGTHTVGTMVGDDGAGNQVGVAPGARWIGCRNMDAGDGTPARYIECMQWMMAPTDLAGNSPRPDLAPDIISNSWGCPASEGCDTGQELREAVDSVVNAGIFFAAAAGNDGNSGSGGCATIFDAPAIYDSAFVVAATTSADGVSSFSSRGPVSGASRVLPDAGAPGSNVRSAYGTSTTAFATLSGTSMATPHVAGAAALLMATNPALKGHPDQIATLLRGSAVHINGGSQSCGGIAAATFPNPVQGAGRIDVYAAFLVAEKIFSDSFGNDTP